MASFNGDGLHGAFVHVLVTRRPALIDQDLRQVGGLQHSVVAAFAGFRQERHQLPVRFDPERDG